MYKYSSSSNSGKRKFPPTHSVPGFLFSLDLQIDAWIHLHWGGQCILLSLWIETLILSTRTLTDIPRAMFGQMSGNLVVQSKHNNQRSKYSSFCSVLPASWSYEPPSVPDVYVCWTEGCSRVTNIREKLMPFSVYVFLSTGSDITLLK